MIEDIIIYRTRAIFAALLLHYLGHIVVNILDEFNYPKIIRINRLTLKNDTPGKTTDDIPNPELGKVFII